MLTPSTDFDPVAPLPPRAVADMLAAGPGQAASTRLVRCAVFGMLGALIVVVIAPAWWLASTPCVALAAFAAWGLATQKVFELDLWRRRAPVLRWLLGLTRGATAVIAGAAALAALIGLLVALMPPGSLH
ncbi:MAG: hypothetical protein M3373_06175 [Gemmatimonadota bacterium]|nr:hypothetical protein [Gemmatimonadota bacterium]